MLQLPACRDRIRNVKKIFFAATDTSYRSLYGCKAKNTKEGVM